LEVALVIVDTSVWIDYLRNERNAETDWLDQRIERQGVGLTDLILTEVLQGVLNDSVFRMVLQDLSEFTMFDTGGVPFAIRSAANYRMLRSKGVTVRKTIDCLTATFCIEGKHTLLHRDRDFDGFERFLGLRVLHPPTADNPRH
jgi:predicted nucleic acid-binding protein